MINNYWIWSMSEKNRYCKIYFLQVKALTRLCIWIKCKVLGSYREHTFKILMLAVSYMIQFQRMSRKHFQHFHLSRDAFGKRVFTLGMMAPSRSCFQISNMVPRTHSVRQQVLRRHKEQPLQCFHVLIYFCSCCAARRMKRTRTARVYWRDGGNFFHPTAAHFLG